MQSDRIVRRVESNIMSLAFDLLNDCSTSAVKNLGMYTQ